MYQRKLTLLLFSPSLLSGAAAIFLALTLNAYGAWTFINDNQLFYGFFSGAYGIQTYLWDATYNLSVWHRTFLSSPLGYYILVGGVAIAAGIAVFTALQLLGVAGKEGREALGERNAYRREALQRLSLRALGLVGWTLYTAFFFSTFLPFVSLLNELGVDMVNRGEQSGILRCVASAAALMIAIHIHVVFARLVVLRPRLFGGINDIERIEATSDHKPDSEG